MHAVGNASQYLIEHVPRRRFEELVCVEHEYEIRSAQAQDVARERRQDLGLKESDALVTHDLDGQTLLDQCCQDLGSTVERSMVDERQVIHHRQVVADEHLDDVGFVAYDGFGVQSHDGANKSAQR